MQSRAEAVAALRNWKRPRAMKITEILSPEMVVPELKGSTKPAVLRSWPSCMCASHQEIQVGDLVAVLAERERLGSTAIGDGIAIPHGKLKGVKRNSRHLRAPSCRASTSSRSTATDASVFLLVAPEDSTSLHLKALARVSRLLKDARLPRAASRGAPSRRAFPPDRGRGQPLLRPSRVRRRHRRCKPPLRRAPKSQLAIDSPHRRRERGSDHRDRRFRLGPRLRDARARGPRLLLRR